MNELAYEEPSWAKAPSHVIQLEIVRGGCMLGTEELTAKAKASQKTYCVLGRVPECDIVVSHVNVSRLHAIIQFGQNDEGDQTMFLYDLGSTHGCKRNGRPVERRKFVEVRVGDQIQLGLATRTFIVCGPSELMPPELDIAECKRKRQEEKEILAKRKQLVVPASAEVTWGIDDSESQPQGEDVIDKYIDEDTGFLMTQKIREDRTELTQKQIVKIGDYEAKLRRHNNLCKERAKFDNMTDALTCGQSEQLQNLDKKLEEVEGNIFSLQEGLLDSLGLCAKRAHVRSTRKRIARLMKDDDEDDDFYDRTKADTAVSVPVVEDAESLKKQREEMLAAKEKLSEELRQLDEKAKKGKSEEDDELEVFMAGLADKLLQQQRKSKRRALDELIVKLTDTERFLGIVQEGAPEPPPVISRVVAEVEEVAAPAPKKKRRHPKKSRDASRLAAGKPAAGTSPAQPDEGHTVNESELMSDESDEDDLPQPPPPTKDLGLEHPAVRKAVEKRRTYGVTPKPLPRDEMEEDGGEEEEDEEGVVRVSKWMPPVGQTGDGKTALNKKFGY